MTAPRVSAVIPTHDRAELLGRAIRSALAQTYPPAELIVVDDGSTDGTARMLRELDDPRVRVLTHPRNLGVSRARNTGIGAASGEWVAFLDSDDEWLTRKLEMQLERLRAADDPRLAVIYGAHDFQDDVSGEKRPHPKRLFEGDLSDHLFEVFGIGTSTVLARREALLAVGGFRETLSWSEDMDLLMRLAVASYRFAAVREPVAILHRHLGPHLNEDPVGRAEAVQILDAEWGSALRRLGGRGYREWRRMIDAYKPRPAYVAFVQAREALRRDGRREAWRRWGGMRRYALTAPRWVAQTAAMIVLGSRGYARLSAVRRSLQGRITGTRA